MNCRSPHSPCQQTLITRQYEAELKPTATGLLVQDVSMAWVPQRRPHSTATATATALPMVKSCPSEGATWRGGHPVFFLRVLILLRLLFRSRLGVRRNSRTPRPHASLVPLPFPVPAFATSRDRCFFLKFCNLWSEFLRRRAYCETREFPECHFLLCCIQ